jgi:tetratricopeptide (TPR) repeat protein
MKRRLVVTPFVLLATLWLGASAQKSLSGKSLTPADSLRAVIEPLFTTAQYDSILSILPGYIGRAEATRDSLLLGRALTQRGRVMLMTGHIADAERDIDTGIRIAEAARDTMGLMPALHFKGFIHTGALRYADARHCFERRVMLAQRMHSPADEAWGHSGIAYILLQTEQFEAARGEYTRAIALFRASGLTGLEITSLIGLGRVESALGDTPAAIRCYQRAWVASREVGDRENEMWAINNLGFHEVERGDLNRAAQYQRRAFEIAREMKSPQSMLIPALNLVSHSEALGDFESAEATLNEVRTLCDAQGAAFAYLRPAVDLYLADLRLRQGRNHEAATLLRRLTAHPEYVDPQHRDDMAIDLALALAASDSVPAAIGVLLDYMKRGEATYREADARVKLAVARLYVDANDYRAALAYATQAHALAQRNGARRGAVSAAFLVSSCRRALGQKDAAVTCFYAALDSMEAFRSGITAADWRESYGQEIARSVVDAGEVLREEPASASQTVRDAAFFDAMQRVKTRTLLDRITQPRAATRASSPGPRVCTLQELQSAMLPGEVLLDFHVGSQRAFMAAVTRDSSRVVVLPGPESRLSDTARLFSRVVGSDDAAKRTEFPPDRLAAVQRALGREILSKVAGLVVTSPRVFVSGDGFYATIPFGLLIAQDGGNTLIVDHDVVQTPSASVLVRERAMDRRVADPKVVAIRAHQSRLQGARDEVRDLERRYAGVRVVDGVADVSQFQQAAVDCDVLHISSHALVIDRSPWLSGVRLNASLMSPVDATAQNVRRDARTSTFAVLTAADSILIERTFRPDPYLRAWQIAPLQLSTRLAVLSGCETAGGRTTTGGDARAHGRISERRRAGRRGQHVAGRRPRDRNGHAFVLSPPRGRQVGCDCPEDGATRDQPHAAPLPSFLLGRFHRGRRRQHDGGHERARRLARIRDRSGGSPPGRCYRTR